MSIFSHLHHNGQIEDTLESSKEELLKLTLAFNESSIDKLKCSSEASEVFVPKIILGRNMHESRISEHQYLKISSKEKNLDYGVRLKAHISTISLFEWAQSLECQRIDDIRISRYLSD